MPSKNERGRSSSSSRSVGSASTLTRSPSPSPRSMGGDDDDASRLTTAVAAALKSEQERIASRKKLMAEKYAKAARAVSQPPRLRNGRSSSRRARSAERDRLGKRGRRSSKSPNGGASGVPKSGKSDDTVDEPETIRRARARKEAEEKARADAARKKKASQSSLNGGGIAAGAPGAKPAAEAGKGLGPEPSGAPGCCRCKWLDKMRAEEAQNFSDLGAANDALKRRMQELEVEKARLEQKVADLSIPLPEKGVTSDMACLQREYRRHVLFGQEAIDKEENPAIVICSVKSFCGGPWLGWVVVNRFRVAQPGRSGDLWYVDPGHYYMFRGQPAADAIRAFLAKWELDGTRAELDWLCGPKGILKDSQRTPAALKKLNYSFLFGGDDQQDHE